MKTTKKTSRQAVAIAMGTKELIRAGKELQRQLKILN